MVNIGFSNARTFKPTIGADGRISIEQKSDPHTRTLGEAAIDALIKIGENSGHDTRGLRQAVRQAEIGENAVSVGTPSADAEVTAQQPTGPTLKR